MLLSVLTLGLLPACASVLAKEWTTHEMNCPERGSPWIQQAQYVAMGTQSRALHTVPPGIRVANSSMENAGLGVFSEIFIPKSTWLAEYEGEIRDWNSTFMKEGYAEYAWIILRGTALHHTVDGWNPATSNWLRYINCPRKRSEENVRMQQCFDKVYYLTGTDVNPGDELLVFYGPGYAHKLGIDMKDYYSEL